jgi:hypothetical protein
MNIKTNKHEYIEQCGCHNCKNCFIMIEYDEDNSYYCTLDASPRPHCGSIFMNENFFRHHLSGDDKKNSKEMNEWYKWSKNREVMAWGICKRFEEKE